MIVIRNDKLEDAKCLSLRTLNARNIYTHTVKQIDFQQRFDARTYIYTCNFAFVSLARCYPTR